MYGQAPDSTSHVRTATGAKTMAAVSSATAPTAWLSRASATSQFQNACRPAEASTSATAPAVSGPPSRRARAAGGRHLELRRVPELAELGRVAAEREVDRPVHDQPDLALDPRHHRQVVGAGQEPGGEAAPLDAERLGDRLLVAHVHEHAERLVGERLRAPGTERGGHVARHRAALAQRVLAGRRRRLAGPGGIGNGGGVADRPHVAAPLDLAEAVDHDPAAAVERQPELLDHRAGRTPAVQATVRHGTTSPSDSSTESAEIRSTVVDVRTSTPRRRSSAVANSASSAEISGITRSRASTRMKRRPWTRERG